MPMYDFKCPKGHVFESITLKYDSEENPVTVECPKCGRQANTFIPVGGRRNVRFNFNYMAP